MRKLIDQEQNHLEGVREFRKQLVVELQLLRDISIVWVNGSVAELLHHLQELGLELERRSSDRPHVPLDREPGHHVGTRRFCRVRRGDPRGPTPTASTALGVAGGTGGSFGGCLTDRTTPQPSTARTFPRIWSALRHCCNNVQPSLASRWRPSPTDLPGATRLCFFGKIRYGSPPPEFDTYSWVIPVAAPTYRIRQKACLRPDRRPRSPDYWRQRRLRRTT